MPGHPSRRTVLRDLFLASLPWGLAGCGTIFHPERRGQPAGRLDWKIVALDAVGLFFFFIPGVIAFAVDFATGTIYLPPEACGRGNLPTSGDQLVPIQTNADRLTHAEVERVVSRETKRDVTLREGQFVSQRMTSLDQFHALRQRQRNTQTTGTSESAADARG